MKMSKRTKLAAAGGTLVLAGFAAGAAAAVTGSASAVGDTLSSVSSAPDGRGDEELLTGTTADKVTAAVEAKYPNATIERVETDSDGVYEAHLVTSAGEELVVQVGKDFAITGAQAGGHGHGHGPGGPGGPGGAGEEPLTGATADKVTAAVEAEYPNATIERVETDSDGVYEAHLVTSAGEELVVQVGRDFAITGTQAGDHGFGGDDRGDDGSGDSSSSGDGGVGGDAA
jgi:predicted  nucleic acid-binding Zn-ribbon protein